MKLFSFSAVYEELSNSSALHVELFNSSALNVKLFNSSSLHVKLSNHIALHVELSSFNHHLVNTLSHMNRRFIHTSNVHLSMILGALQDLLK